MKALSSRGEIAFGVPVKIFVAFSLSFVTFAHSKKREPVFSAFSLRQKTDFQLVSTKKTAGKKKLAKAPVASAKPKHAATAASILGRPVVAKPGMTRSKNTAGPMPIKPEWQKYYETLIDLRERLVAQMSGLAKESAEELAGYSLHMADSGTDNFDRDFALSLLSSDQDAVYEIEEALKRIEKHTYGICELTGKAIPRARLEAIPWTRFTVEAQAQLERDGALRSRRLGQLGSVDSVGGSDAESGGGDEEEAEEKPKSEKD
jgi:DnaK suppressor protein